MRIQLQMLDEVEGYPVPRHVDMKDCGKFEMSVVFIRKVCELCMGMTLECGKILNGEEFGWKEWCCFHLVCCEFV